MSSILIIARNTFREIIRDRILYGLIVFSLLLISLSMLLGQLSFAEQIRISMNFGLTAIHMGTVILSVFVGSTLVYKEIDKKTIMTILVRPISRTQFLLGKALGLSMVNIVVISGLSLVLIGILKVLGADLSPAFFVALHGVALEGIVLLGITLLFSSFSTPFMVVSFTMGVFLVGHWIESLQFFVESSESSAFILFQKVLNFVWPNLELLNWREQAVYADPISTSEVFYSSFYSIGWFALTITLTALILRKKDFA